MAMITLNLIMTYQCKIHHSCELEVFQPANGLCYVTPCIQCVQEKDALHNQIVSLQNKFNKGCLTRLKQTKAKAKRERSLYLDGRKINFVTKKKGGKK